MKRKVTITLNWKIKTLINMKEFFHKHLEKSQMNIRIINKDSQRTTSI